MKKQIIFSLFATILITLLWSKYGTEPLKPELRKGKPTTQTRSLNSGRVAQIEATQFKVEAPLPQRRPAAEPALNSLSEMSRTLFAYTRPGIPLKDLVSYLQRSKQEPQVGHDRNPYTGDMAIVRVKTPLPGTRYFHAQYFADSDGTSFVQHMSFEYKPGPEAMRQAIAAVKASFPGLGAPKTAKPDFIEWALPEGRTVWIKKMAAEDLADDPYNAYGPRDIGTIRVAIESDVHGHEG